MLIFAVEQHPELPDFTAQVVFVIDHIIEALRQDALVLRFLERNSVWPGLTRSKPAGEAEPLMRKLLAIVLSSPEMAGRSEREVYQRITALGSMCMSVCYSSILEGKPDNIDAMKPVLYDIIRRALFAGKSKKERIKAQKVLLLQKSCGKLSQVDMTWTVSSAGRASA